MRITYIGQKHGNSLHRAKALERLGHEVTLIDPWAWLAKTALLARVHFNTGYTSFALFLTRRFFREVQAAKPELIWVNQGEFIGPRVVRDLRKMGVPIVNYANDNAFCSENRKRFYFYRAAVPYYDLLVVMTAGALEGAKRAGAKKVVQKPLCADDVAQRCNIELGLRPSFEVVFIGTWMKKQRGPFMAELIRRGVPLSIWGDQWQKSKEWSIIRPYWRGPGVYDDQGYADIIQSGKICLGLLNQTSGDLHTDRSIQIPALGSLLCAQRTSTHVEMYDEGNEAVFWDDAEECATLCHDLLSDETRRAAIAAKGHRRALRNNIFNEPVLASILKEVEW